MQLTSRPFKVLFFVAVIAGGIAAATVAAVPVAALLGHVYGFCDVQPTQCENEECRQALCKTASITTEVLASSNIQSWVCNRSNPLLPLDADLTAGELTLCVDVRHAKQTERLLRDTGLGSTPQSWFHFVDQTILHVPVYKRRCSFHRWQEGRYDCDSPWTVVEEAADSRGRKLLKAEALRKQKLAEEEAEK